MLTGCGSDDDDDGGDSGTTNDDLQNALASIVSDPDGPVGVITVVDTGDEVSVHTAGTVSVDSSEAPGSGDHMRIASLAKAFTAAVAYTLVEDGVLSLDDTVGKWRPDLPAAWKDITLAEVMNHTGGVPDFGGNPAFGEAVGESPTVAPEPTAIVAFAGQGVDFPAGSKYQYSNTGPFVTALIIESATGMPFREVLGQQVLDPLGMKDTTLPANDDPTVPAPTFAGYDPGEDGEPEDVTEVVNFGGWAWSSGGIVSTPDDLTKFVQGYVGGDLITGATRDAQFEFFGEGNSEPRGPGDNRVGKGMFEYTTRCGTVYGHSGSVFGYTQYMAASEDGTKSVTFTINTQYGDELLPKIRAAEELAICEAFGK